MAEPAVAQHSGIQRKCQPVWQRSRWIFPAAGTTTTDASELCAWSTAIPATPITPPTTNRLRRGPACFISSARDNERYGPERQRAGLYAVQCTTSAVFRPVGKLGQESGLGQSGSASPATEFSLRKQLAATHSTQQFLQHVDADFLFPLLLHLFIMVMIRRTYQ